MTTPTEALKIARDALADMIRAGKQAKVDLTTGIRDGEPVHPVSASLTFPLATAINAIAAIDALAQPQPSTPSVEPPTIADVLDALNVFNPPEAEGGDVDPWTADHFISVSALPEFIHNVGRAWYVLGLTPLPATATEAQADTTPSVAGLVAMELERIAQDPPVSGNVLTQTRVLMAAANVREFGLAGGTTPQAAPVAPEPVKADGRLHADGYFTWARRDGYAMDKKLPCDFYLAATPPAAPAPAVQPLSEEAIERHAMSASICPPGSQVMLVGTLRKLGITAAPAKE